MDKITLSHGSGGVLTQELISKIFLKVFKNPYLDALDDAAIFALSKHHYALTTDSFVVDPIIFPGGDIGKLAVCGTVNDLASCAAEPKFLTAGFILEEGLSFDILNKIVVSMSRQAKAAGVEIVTGDTKVVPRGKVDKIFINTTGVGMVKKRLSSSCIRPGDKILINGCIAQHGLSILLKRQNFSYSVAIKSDCNPLWGIVKLLLNANIDIRFMRDPTRGGVSSAMNEIATACRYSFLLQDSQIPVDNSCRHLGEILGLELLDIANEGKMLFFVNPKDAHRALRIMRSHPCGKNAAMIGETLVEKKSRVYLKTAVGGLRVVGSPLGESLPRIC
jgi:hydrogenase expression/formation protein HypE